MEDRNNIQHRLRKRVSALFPFSIFLVLLLSSSVYAQEASLPTTANPAFVGQSLPQRPSARVQPLLTPTLTEKPSPLAGQTGVTFKLTHVTVVGATVYSNEELERMFQPAIGKTISVADLQAMADAITTKYKKDGYILSKAVIPAQTIKGGAVTIQVIEGYIENVSIEGKPKKARGLLKKYLARIQQERPLTAKTLERYILLANDIPGVTAKAVIQPTLPQPTGKGKVTAPPGAADLVLVTNTATADGYMAYDNRGTLYLGPQQYSGGGDFNSSLLSGDQLGFQGLITTDFEEAYFLRPYYQIPVGSRGTTLNLSGSYTHTQPGFTLEPLEVIGIYSTTAAVVNYPIIRTRNRNLYITGDFDTSENRSTLLNGLVLLYNDRIRSMRLGLTYDFADRFRGLNQIAVQGSQGIPLFGASPSGGPNLSRPDGESSYTKFTLDSFRIQGLPHNFSALLGLKGQYAFTPLLTAEEFTLGGVQYGRAYDPAEIVGDRGIAGKAELRYDIYPKWRWLTNIEPFTYYDIGEVFNIGNEGGQFQQASLSSAGLGVRGRFLKYVSGSLELDKPLTRKVATYNNNDARGFFSIIAAF